MKDPISTIERSAADSDDVKSIEDYYCSLSSIRRRIRSTVLYAYISPMECTPCADILIASGLTNVAVESAFKLSDGKFIQQLAV